MPWLLLESAGGEGQSFRVESSAVTIGRSDDATIVIEHRSLSRMHATILREGDGYVVTDLGSKNGTFLNNQRIQHASLKNGDLLRCGEVALRFQLNRAEPQQTGTESLPLPAGIFAPGATTPGASMNRSSPRACSGSRSRLSRTKPGRSRTACRSSPRPNTSTWSWPRARYSLLRSVISSSPRGDGVTWRNDREPAASGLTTEHGAGADMAEGGAAHDHVAVGDGRLGRAFAGDLAGHP